jgi:hypothetical protein
MRPPGFRRTHLFSRSSLTLFVENKGDFVDNIMIMWISRWIGCAWGWRHRERFVNPPMLSGQKGKQFHFSSQGLQRVLERASRLLPLIHTHYYHDGLSSQNKNMFWGFGRCREREPWKLCSSTSVCATLLFFTAALTARRLYRIHKVTIILLPTHPSARRIRLR